MKHLLGLFLLFLCFSANAEMAPLPACNVDGKPIEYKLSDDRFVIAEAGRENGIYTIWYNKQILSTHPKEWQTQVLLHECGHLQLHTDRQIYSYSSDFKEYEADCYSANRLKNEYRYTKIQLDIVMSTMASTVGLDRTFQFKQCLKRY